MALHIPRQAFYLQITMPPNTTLNFWGRDTGWPWLYNICCGLLNARIRCMTYLSFFIVALDVIKYIIYKCYELKYNYPKAVVYNSDPCDYIGKKSVTSWFSQMSPWDGSQYNANVLIKRKLVHTGKQKKVIQGLVTVHLHSSGSVTVGAG